MSNAVLGTYTCNLNILKLEAVSHKFQANLGCIVSETLSQKQEERMASGVLTEEVEVSVPANTRCQQAQGLS